MESFWDNIHKCIRRYFCFKGKASRSEFWQWVLFVVCSFILLLTATCLLLLIQHKANYAKAMNVVVWISQMLILAFLLFSIPPSLAVCVRRLRDAGFRPWIIVFPILLLIGRYHPFLDLALSGMDDTPPDMPLPLSCGYLTFTALVCLLFIVLLSWKSAKQ